MPCSIGQCARWCASALLQHWGYAYEGRGEGVDVGRGGVGREAGAHGAGYAVAVHDRLGAVMACAHGNAELVEQQAGVVGVGVAYEERYYRGFVRGTAYDAQVVDGKEALCGVVQQLFFVAGNGRHAYGLQVVDGGTEAQHVGHRGGAGLELEGQHVVGGTLELDVGNHLAAAVVGRHGVEQLLFAIEHAYAHGAVHLVRREAVEVAAEGLHVDGCVCHCLRAVDKHGDAVRVGYACHVGHGVDGAEGVAHMGGCHEACARGEELAVGLDVEHPFVAVGHKAQHGFVVLGGELPWHEVGVVLHGGNNNLVALAQRHLRERGGNEVDALGGAPREDDLARFGGAYELRHLAARELVELSGLGGKVVRAAVYVAVEVGVVVAYGVDHTARFLRGGGVVEVYKGVVVYLGVEYLEIGVR